MRHSASGSMSSKKSSGRNTKLSDLAAEQGPSTLRVFWNSTLPSRSPLPAFPNCQQSPERSEDIASGLEQAEVLLGRGKGSVMGTRNLFPLRCLEDGTGVLTGMTLSVPLTVGCQCHSRDNVVLFWCTQWSGTQTVPRSTYRGCSKPGTSG